MSQTDCRLYLVVDAGGPPPSLPDLRQALATGAVASILLEPADASTGLIERWRPVVATAQQAGAAVLVAEFSALARAIGADGLHLTAPDRDAELVASIAEARLRLGPAASVGVATGAARHPAMVAGEAGADYVAVGGSDAEGRAELIAWWAELFETPVVAWCAASPAEAQTLAAAGADFVGVRVTAEGFAEAVAAYAAALQPARHER